MNASAAALPVGAPVPAVPGIFGPAAPVRLARLLASVVLTVALFDTCFWEIHGLGLSVAIFFTGLAGIILWNREGAVRRRASRVLSGLMAGAVVAAVIETGVTNILVFLALTVAIAGEVFFGEIASPWGRWLSQGVALLRAPGRLLWLVDRLVNAALGQGAGWVAGSIGSVLMLGVAIFLVLVFGTMLATGNAVFGSWTNDFFNWIWKELASWLDPARLFLWFIVALAALALVRPAQVSASWWRWTQQLPRLPEILPGGLASGGSALILAMLNLLFLVANLADALFLWSGEALPKGVNYSQFVHSGVDSLTATVLLSAFVLTAIFQQAPAVSGRRGLKVLALVWIAQNVFLILSVVLRLKLYIEAYHMTVARLGVMIFLLLVTAGYGLLTMKIVRDKSLSWLVGGCAMAIFATFYITQFLNLAGWSADYNVAQWEKDRTHELDTCYLAELGPAAWPAMQRVESNARRLPSGLYDVRKAAVDEENRVARAQFNAAHWREFELRAWLNRGALE